MILDNRIINNSSKVVVLNTKFIQNYGGNNAIINTFYKSHLILSNCEFEDNYSLGFGSVIFSNSLSSFVSISNSLFSRNYAIEGGVFKIQ